MRHFVVLLSCLAPALVSAKVLNVEFKFTPFVGDTKNDQVTVVAGTARVMVNGVPVAEQPIEKHTVPVLFDAREVGPAVWLPAESLGPAIRQGKNVFRVEFEPADAKAKYRARLAWATVVDEVAEQREPGRVRSTNQAGEGAEEKAVTGRIALEREFTGDFAADHPWHHYPPVTALTDDDRQRLGAVVKEAVDRFKPDFSDLYTQLGTKKGVDVASARQHKCFEAAYAAGVRLTMPPIEQLDFVTTGQQEVVVRKKGGDLFDLDPKAFEKIKGGDEMKMCAGMALSMLYPPRMVFVRKPDGTWMSPY